MIKALAVRVTVNEKASKDTKVPEERRKERACQGAVANDRSRVQDR